MPRLLVVDDEKSIRVTLCALLQCAGYEVEMAEDATQAQALLSNGVWDVVVSDIVLPGVSGVELLKTIRAVAPDVQVVMMTGEPTAETAAEAVRAGASDYLTKPVSKNAILRSVAIAVKIKHFQDEKRRLGESNRQYQQNLEKLVAERTQALQDSNQHLEAALAEIQRTQAQMVREERLSALGQMASGIAHDFNNVLMPIVGYSEMLLARPETLSNPDVALSWIKQISDAAQDATHIIQRLRLIRGSEEEGEHLPVDINEIAGSAVEMTRTRWDKEKRAKGVRINILTPLRADKRVMGDTSQLREALINLILNAVDAMPKGGRLTLSSAVEKKEVVVEVSDTGTGMTDDAKARCMEPFFTTKGVEGTGLGLAMVHGIVTRHNGTMKIDSTLGSGTTIQIRLPFAPAEPMTAEPRKGAAEKGLMIAPLRILVADDDAKSRDLVEKMLTKDGHAIETARTGWEAIDKVHAGTYDLVITDRSMPEGNGDLVALSVKERNPETPVILLTGFGDIMKDEGEHPAGVDRILTKPVSHHDLRHAIIKVMQKGLP